MPSYHSPFHHIIHHAITSLTTPSPHSPIHHITHHAITLLTIPSHHSLCHHITHHSITSLTIPSHHSPCHHITHHTITSLTVPSSVSNFSQAGSRLSRASTLLLLVEAIRSGVGVLRSWEFWLSGRHDDAAELLPRLGREGKPSNLTRRKAWPIKQRGDQTCHTGREPDRPKCLSK